MALSRLREPARRPTAAPFGARLKMHHDPWGEHSSLKLRVVSFSGRRTSIRLEPGFWDALSDSARRRGITLSDLLSEIDRERDCPSFTAAVRSYLVTFYRRLVQTAEDSKLATRIVHEIGRG